MSEPAADYLLGTTDEELGRLKFQHEAWYTEAEQLWQLAAFGTDQTLLDLGCGPGFATLDLASMTGPNGRIYAVDASQKYLDFLNQNLTANSIKHVTPQLGDVGQLDIPDGCIDGIFARWLFCFLRDPQSVLDECFRVLRPGGHIVLWDYFNYLSARFFPGRASIESLFSAFEESNNRLGGSYHIGGRLPQMLTQSGFEVTALQPMCKTIQPGTVMWQWFELFKNGFGPSLVDEGLLTESQFAEIEHDIAELGAQPGTFFFPPPQIGIVARKIG